MNKKILEKIEALGWNIEKIENNTYELSKYSPAGQDFNIIIEGKNDKEFADNLYKRYRDYDISEETSLWLDDSGHGANGAPYDMKDLYEDMKSCKDNLFNLYREITYKYKG